MRGVEFKTINEHIASHSAEIQKTLKQIRKVIKKAIPDGDESISYGIPAYKLKGTPVIYFAGYKNHISLYPAPREDPEFKAELSRYKGGKGTLQFPLNEAPPLDLIKRIVEFRRMQVEARLAAPKKTSTTKSKNKST